MTPADFLSRFGTIADAPNGIAKLRELILQLAVQGKLVQQDPGDEPVAGLLGRIRAERERLAASAEILRVSDVVDLGVAERPWDVPPAWAWCRLAEVVAILDHRRVPVNQAERDSRIAGKPTSALFPYFGATQQVGWIDGYLFDEELVLLGEDGVPFLHPARPKAYVISGKNWVNNHAHVLRAICGSSQFLAHALNVTDYSDRVTGTTRLKLTQGKMIRIPIPVPPLREQHRIVAKVDELMALCDELEARQERQRTTRRALAASSLAALANAPDAESLAKAWPRVRDHLDELITEPESIPTLRQAILQLAVRGQLVRQDPNDEPVLVRPRESGARLAPIDDATIPFESPARMSWVRLGEVVGRMDSGWSPDCEDHPTRNPNEWGVLRTTAVQALEYREREHKALPPNLEPRPEHEARPGDILITRAGPKSRVGICCLVGDTRPRLMISDKIIRFHLKDPWMLPEFVALSLNAGYSKDFVETQKSGMAVSQMNISQVKLQQTPIPVLPYAEQRRIVAKVDELMALCDQLEARLTQARATTQALASSTTHHLVTPRELPAGSSGLAG